MKNRKLVFFIVFSICFVIRVFAYENTAYHLNLADEYKKQNNWESAKKEYEKVIELDSAHWVAYTELAHIYTIENNYIKAKDLCLKALDYNSNNYMAWNILGGCYHELGEDPKKTEDAFLNSLRLNLNRAAMQGLIGTVGDYEKEGRYIEAEELLNNLLSLPMPESNRKDLEEWLIDVKAKQGK